MVNLGAIKPEAGPAFQAKTKDFDGLSVQISRCFEICGGRMALNFVVNKLFASYLCLKRIL